MRTIKFLDKIKKVFPKSDSDPTTTSESDLMETLDQEIEGTQDNLAKPAAKHGTRLNRKFVRYGALFVLLLFIFTFYYEMHKSSQEVKIDQQPPQTASTTSYSRNDFPSDYSQVKAPQTSNSKKEVPIPAEAPTPPSIPSQPNNQLLQAEIARLQREAAEEEAAMKSRIGFINIANASTKPNESSRNIESGSAMPSIIETTEQDEYGKQNRQDDKRAFLNEKPSTNYYNNQPLISPISKYEVKAGKIIPCAIVTAISSDLPGKIVARVTENIYDSVTGDYLLIPQGTEVIGTYDSYITYGQNRVLVIWQRMILPNGNSVGVENMQGVDLSGKSGLKDKVNNHTWALLKGIVLSSGMAAVAAVSTSSGTDDNSFEAAAGRGAAQAVLDAGAKITEKNINRQPTIEIRAGHQFNVFVHQDLVLMPYRD